MSPSKRPKRGKSKPKVSALREQIAEANEAALLLEPAEIYDQAIIGLTSGIEPVVVYDHGLIVEALIESGQSEEDAVEWIDYNIIGSLGQAGSPVILNRCLDDYL